MRYAAGCMVWSSVAFVIVLCVVMTVFTFSKAGFIGVSDLQAMTGSSAEEMEGRSMEWGFCWSGVSVGVGFLVYVYTHLFLWLLQ